MKKLLALVLALVMTLGLATVGTSAAFSDADSIEYKEAVDVMSSIGVIAGMDNGSFNPTGTLTREQGAKILSYMLMGGKTAGDALTTSRAPFTDVAANRWSAGAIAYCANAGILAGIGDGKFNPEGELTGYAFSKMLLTALGYDAKREGLTGGDWELNVARLVNSINLLDGLGGVVYNQAITRDQAAKLAYNTLTKDMVEYRGTLTADQEGNFAAARNYVANTAYSYVINNGVMDEAATETLYTTNGRMQFVENYFPTLKCETKDNEFGVDTDYWFTAASRTDANRTADKTIVSAPASTIEKKVVFTKAVEDGDIYTALGLSSNVAAANTVVVRNGKSEGTTPNMTYSTGTTDSASYAITKGGDTEIGGRGTTVEVYKDPDDTTAPYDYKIIVTDWFVGKVASVTAATSSADRYITISNASGKTPNTYEEGTRTLNYKFETEDFAKDDMVLFSMAYDSVNTEYAVQEVKKLEKAVSGEVTAYTGATTVAGKNFTVDGTKYEYALNAYNKDTNISSKAKVDLYLDEFGYVAYLEATDLTTNYAVVLGVGSTNAYGTTGGGATLLLGDGTTKTVEYENGTNAVSTGAIVGDPTTKQSLVTYTVGSNDKYKLSMVSTAGAKNANYADIADLASTTTNKTADNAQNATDAAKIEVTKGKSGVTMPNKDGTTLTAYATSKTVFFIAQKTAAGEYKSYNVYTGYANVPSIAATKVVHYAVDFNGTKTSQIDAMYLVVDETNNAGSDIFVLKTPSVDKITSNDVIPYVEMPAVVEGEYTTLKVDATLLDSNKILGASGGYILSSISKDSDDVVTAVGVRGTSDSHTFLAIGTVSESNNVIGLGNGFFSYNDKTVVVVIKDDLKKTVPEKSVSTIADIETDANDIVTYVLDSNDEYLKAVYIRKVSNTAADVKTLTITSDATVTGVYLDAACNYQLPSGVKLAKDTVVYVKQATDATADASFGTAVSGTQNKAGAVYAVTLNADKTIAAITTAIS